MTSFQRQYHEKRDYIRMEINSPLTLTLSDSHKISGLCMNLSGVGMLIQVPEPLEIGLEAEVHLPSYQQSFPPLTARVKVQRLEANDGKEFCYGTAILEIIN